MALVMRVNFTDILQRRSLKNYYMHGRVEGFQFQVRLSYYRGHFLSVIEKLGVKIDDEAVPKKDILFCLNGKEFIVDDLKNQPNEFWNIVAPATIKVRKAGGLEPGKHKVTLELMLRNPYLPLPGSTEEHCYTPIDSCDEQVMELC